MVLIKRLFEFAKGIVREILRPVQALFSPSVSEQSSETIVTCSSNQDYLMARMQKLGKSIAECRLAALDHQSGPAPKFCGLSVHDVMMSQWWLTRASSIVSGAKISLSLTPEQVKTINDIADSEQAKLLEQGRSRSSFF